MIARPRSHDLVVHDDTLSTMLGEIRPVPHSLGRVIKDCRRELGWSQEALAARVVALGDGTFRQSDVSRLERGKVGLPHRERLRHIAAALELSLGELLARSGWAGATAAFIPQEPPMPATTATPHDAVVPVAVPGEAPPPLPLPVVTCPPRELMERHDRDRLHVALVDARATRVQTHRILAHSQALVDHARDAAGSDPDGTAMRAPALREEPRLPYPRYRVEERVPDQAAFIVGFADTPLQYASQVACQAAQLRRAHVTADLVVIEQDTETVIQRGAV